MRVNTSTWCQSPLRIRCASSSFLRSRGTGCTFCAMLSAVWLRRATSISTGLFSSLSASALISSLKVAENSRLCFFAGTIASTFLMSWMKPMSSMRSASSSTKISTCSGRACAGRGGRAGGRAWRRGCRRRAAACRSAAACRRRRTSPCWSACCTCRRRARFLRPARRVRASGVRISARIGSLPRASRTAGVAISRCSIGSAKPAVLPVPVCAPPSRSPPDSTAGMACAWIGVGVS